ncbi:hypothetical protein [Anoxynatronum sibiricum]|uniref:hypothetical protein n=1 Tax=Anoxynatronum sibiricum TaxID=210623 RepID=UPI0031B80883
MDTYIYMLIEIRIAAINKYWKCNSTFHPPTGSLLHLPSIIQIILYCVLRETLDSLLFLEEKVLRSLEKENALMTGLANTFIEQSLIA